uniref:Uncharacterized protein n=1 Tax=Suricata suricatta TaxID=37032 RepID=A0A673UUD8_SURSU
KPTPLYQTHLLEFSQPHSCLLASSLSSAGIEVWNPAFDVTPHDLITGGIITELGVFAPEELRAALSTSNSFTHSLTLPHP